MKREDAPIYSNPDQDKILLAEFTKSWKTLNLFGKKLDEFAFHYKIFLEDLSDISSYRISESLKIHRKDNSNFPTAAEIRAIGREMDYNLTQPQQKHRIMHQRARNKNMGLFMNDDQERELEEYELKHGKINLSLDWAGSYDELFDIQEG